MKWNKATCFALIAEYQKQHVLWHQDHALRYSKAKKDEAWRTIGEALNVDENEVKQKMINLMGSYRREKSKEKRTRDFGIERGGRYISKWFAFKRMSFLHGRREAQPIDSDIMDVKTEADDFKGQAEAFNWPAPQQFHNEEVEHAGSKPEVHLGRKRVRVLECEDVESGGGGKCETSSFREEEDRYDVVGKYVAHKLRCVDNLQRIYAEKLINDVLFEAELGTLDRNCTVMCDVELL